MKLDSVNIFWLGRNILGHVVFLEVQVLLVKGSVFRGDGVFGKVG